MAACLRDSVNFGSTSVDPDQTLDADELLTIDEAAMLLGVTSGGVRALERRGHLSSAPSLNGRRYRLAEVAMLAQRKRLKTNRHQRIPSQAEVERRTPRSRRRGGRDAQPEEVA